MVVVSGIVINNRIVSNSDGEKHNHNNNTFRLRTTHTYTHKTHTHTKHTYIWTACRATTHPVKPISTVSDQIKSLLGCTIKCTLHGLDK